MWRVTVATRLIETRYTRFRIRWRGVGVESACGCLLGRAAFASAKATESSVNDPNFPPLCELSANPSKSDPLSAAMVVLEFGMSVQVLPSGEV